MRNDACTLRALIWRRRGTIHRSTAGSAKKGTMIVDGWKAEELSGYMADAEVVDIVVLPIVPLCSKKFEVIGTAHNYAR